MTNTFCLSFSDIGFQLLHLIQQDDRNTLHSAEQFSYTSTVPIDQIISDENILFISKILGKYIAEKGILSSSLSIVLPFNFAEIKRIILPQNSDKNLKRNQIQWELETTLSGDLRDYKVSILAETEKEFYNYAVVVAIKKSIINRLQSIAEQNKADISNVLLNCFSIENYLVNHNTFNVKKNYVFLKVNKNYIEHHFFSGDKYLLSQIDLIDSSSRSRNEVVVEIVNDRHKNISNFIDKEQNDNPLEFFAYGSSLTDETYDALKKGLSSKVNYALIESINSTDSFKYIEAWGSVL